MPVSRTVLGGADTFVRVLVRALRVRFLERFFRLFGGVTFFVALRGRSKCLLWLTDALVYESCCATSVPTLQRPSMPTVDQVLPRIYDRMFCVHTIRDIHEFLYDPTGCVYVRYLEEVKFILIIFFWHWLFLCDCANYMETALGTSHTCTYFRNR